MLIGIEKKKEKKNVKHLYLFSFWGIFVQPLESQGGAFRSRHEEEESKKKMEKRRKIGEEKKRKRREEP